MKTIIACLCVFIFVFPGMHIQADIYVKGILRVEEGYRNGRFEPEFEVVHEWWFGKNKITFIRHRWSDVKDKVWLPHLRITLNKERQRITVINFNEKSFLEVLMPMNLLSPVDQSAVGVLKTMQIDGTINKTNKVETINKKKCHVYEVTEKIYFQKLNYYDKDRIVMVTGDVPFNWQLADELYQWIRSFFNPKELYLWELKKMKGFVWSTTETLFLHGYQVKMSFQVQKILHKKAPENIYGIPPGFKKKEKLSMKELMDMLKTIYVVVP